MSASEGRFARSFQYLAWSPLVAAVLDVFIENQASESVPETFKASSDTWVITDSLRRDVYERAIEKWCERTGHDLSYFPLSVDGVARIYLRIRKLREGEIEDLAAELKSTAGNVPAEGNLFQGDRQ